MQKWEKEVLPDVGNMYGAPMGRHVLLPPVPTAPIKLHLRRMRMVDYDYDAGGAYWGGAMGVPGERLWVAWGHARENMEEFLVRVIVRGWPRSKAKQNVRAQIPGAVFYR